MIVAGIILLLLAYLLPDVLPDVPPGILHVCYVLGWVALIIGIILFLLGLIGGGRYHVGGRRFWY
jgi:Flp pilus assembly protein protease CpaA